jgi:hypothetical protein
MNRMKNMMMNLMNRLNLTFSGLVYSFVAYAVVSIEKPR